MTQRRWLIVLGLAAAAVTLQNLVFFSKSGPETAEVEDWGEAIDQLLGAEGEEGPPKNLDPVDAEALQRWMAELERQPRSPFLTRAEAEELGAQAETGLPSLAGVLWSRGRRVAWLDGVPHGVGDRVGEHRLEHIGPGSVTLVLGDERVQLAIEPPKKNDHDWESTDER